jgi:hypothetical protein
MKKVLKIFGAATVLVLGVITIRYLQFRFDRSDIEHAVLAVRSAKPEGRQGPTIEEKISDRYGVATVNIQWFSEIESKTQGIVRVQAKVPGSSDDLSWRVDLVRFNITPATPKAAEIAHIAP